MMPSFFHTGLGHARNENSTCCISSNSNEVTFKKNLVMSAADALAYPRHEVGVVLWRMPTFQVHELVTVGKKQEIMY